MTAFINISSTVSVKDTMEKRYAERCDKKIDVTRSTVFQSYQDDGKTLNDKSKMYLRVCLLQWPIALLDRDKQLNNAGVITYI